MQATRTTLFAAAVLLLIATTMTCVAGKGSGTTPPKQLRPDEESKYSTDVHNSIDYAIHSQSSRWEEDVRFILDKYRSLIAKVKLPRAWEIHAELFEVKGGRASTHSHRGRNGELETFVVTFRVKEMGAGVGKAAAAVDFVYTERFVVKIGGRGRLELVEPTAASFAPALPVVGRVDYMRAVGHETFDVQDPANLMDEEEGDDHEEGVEEDVEEKDAEENTKEEKDVEENTNEEKDVEEDTMENTDEDTDDTEDTMEDDSEHVDDEDVGASNEEPKAEKDESKPEIKYLDLVLGDPTNEDVKDRDETLVA